ncbi:SusC/RagA family TonB-linked outer membrane protein [Sphingobacterium yanglingense]|uniref:TonB-linked SusC/RagA family outer membrane protein n=1 Tax=Sphingobacterium yanglingense TaxID=1437280 RepID=A0A4R6WLU7_9SPHI|nr:SusC/RagA family TonB-linked outer membrane protein [Sphingobacterium yanglingense]TDQ79742.1 TonB-linked SusC/RagA family outer membrane protein [Sphingobacterium yanglingense]
MIPKFNLRQILLSSQWKNKMYKRLIAVALISLSLSPLYASIIGFTFKKKNVTIEAVLKELEKQTSYNLFYKFEEVRMLKKVDVNFVNAPLKEVLDQLISSNGLTYSITDNTIIIKTTVLNSPPVKNSTGVLQTGIIRGKISDRTTQAPLSGATLKVNNKSQQSNNNGEFVLNNVKLGDRVEISFTGYIAKTITLSDFNDLDVALELDYSSLDEVVVTGYTVQKKRELTGAISSLKASDVAGSLAVSVDGAMQGRMSGVNVQSRVGVPGAAIKVEVRGPGSISAGTEPLYIVDGLIVNNNNVSNTVSTNPLANINPEDILTIEVLKDAAAASVYGAQAGNGVVLITTKKGKEGRATIDVGYRGGNVMPINLLPLMNSQQYLNARYEALKNKNPNQTDEQIWKTVLTQSRLDVNMNANDIAALETYDWQKAAYTGGGTNKFDLAVSGGTSTSNYRLSGSWEDTEGSIIGSDFSRGTVNMNYNNQLSKKVSVQTNVNLSAINQHGPLGATGTTTQFSSPSYANPMILPFLPIYNEDGSYNFSLAGFPGTFTRNTLHSTALNESRENNNSLFGNIQINYRILDNLTYKGMAGIDYRDISARQYYDPRSIDGNARGGILIEYTDEPITFTTTHTLQYAPKLADGHSLNNLLGTEYRSFSNQGGNVRGEGFPNHLFTELASAAVIVSATSQWTGVKRMGSFFQSNYNYADKYFASGIIRYDGSSRFGTNSKFGFFPAISLGWDMAQEDFIKNQAVNQLKLRLGYGQTGNDQIGNFASRSLYGGGITYNGSAGIQSNTLGNSELRWEKNVTTNLGLDYAFFNSRIYGSIEAYHRLSKDLLLDKPVVWAGGYSQITQNLGEVINQGLEFEVGAVVWNRNNFKWTSNFNISFQRNEVTKLYDDVTLLPGDNSVMVGQSLRTFLLPQYAGVNSATGRAVWYDKEGNYSYNPGTMELDSYAPHGLPNELPDFYGGFNNLFEYKGISVGIFFQYDYGRVLYDNFARNLSRKGDSQINGMAWYYDNRWLSEGQITSVPRPIDGAAETNNARGDLASTRYLQDGSYIRLKNINLGYQLPKTIISKVGLKQARVFMQGNNLYTWTKFAGYDPEFYVVGSNTSSNVGVVPTAKSYYFGVQLSF